MIHYEKNQEINGIVFLRAIEPLSKGLKND